MLTYYIRHTIVASSHPQARRARWAYRVCKVEFQRRCAKARTHQSANRASTSHERHRDQEGRHSPEAGLAPAEPHDIAQRILDEGIDVVGVVVRPVHRDDELGLAVDLRDYRQCAEILFDLGLCRVRVISNNPLKLRALEEAGLKIVERVSIEVDSSEDAAGGEYPAACGPAVGDRRFALGSLRPRARGAGAPAASVGVAAHLR